jgi:riboflavin kinase / FMN adenylyltransferase
MRVVAGIEALTDRDGPSFVVVGVFDGLHLGHRYLLERLVEEATARDARPTVITFDHHPDEVLTGQAPPLLIDPEERLERLEAAGVEVTVVQHFDAELRETPFETFVERIRHRVTLRGFLMTPDAAFGFERQGTPGALATLGARDGFNVVVIPPFDAGGRPVRSNDIRVAIANGELGEAGAMLGRRWTLRGSIDDDGRLHFALPMALPRTGRYPVLVGDAIRTLEIRDGLAWLPGQGASPRITAEGLAPARTAEGAED